MGACTKGTNQSELGAYARGGKEDQRAKSIASVTKLIEK